MTPDAAILDMQQKERFRLPALLRIRIPTVVKQSQRGNERKQTHEVQPAVIESAPDIRFRYVMTSEPYASFHSRDMLLGGSETGIPNVDLETASNRLEQQVR